jgi:hypothetical protein
MKEEATLGGAKFAALHGAASFMFPKALSWKSRWW